MTTVHQSPESDIETRRYELGLSLSRLMAFGAGVAIPLLLVGVWFVDREQTLLLALALVIGVMLPGWGPYPYLYRHGRPKLGIWLGLISLAIPVALAPIVLPSILPAAMVGGVVYIAQGLLLLGKKASITLIGSISVCLIVAYVAIQQNLNLPISMLDPNTAAVAGGLVNLMALIIGGLIIRTIVIGQEEQYERAQQANQEIEQRIAVEQTQNERIVQINGELETRIAIDQQRRDFLEQLVNEITEATYILNESVLEIQAAATQQLASVTEQDASIVQTATTVEQVRATAVETAHRAQTVAESSRDSIKISEEGRQAVTDTISGMSIVRERVDDIAETILLLSERTQQIGEIVETVEALSEQSKLLALNASIEAARAGDEGRGFAVVAMEVRQLAEQSRQATARITNIIHEIQRATNQAVMVTEEGSKGADAGVTLVERAGQAINRLTAVIEDAADTATQIAVTTDQQTTGMDQLVQAINQIRQASSQTAASTTQTERSVRELGEMARRLGEMAGQYEPSVG